MIVMVVDDTEWWLVMTVDAMLWEAYQQGFRLVGEQQPL